jgi:hypothetical protein
MRRYSERVLCTRSVSGPGGDPTLTGDHGLSIPAGFSSRTASPTPRETYESTYPQVAAGGRDLCQGLKALLLAGNLGRRPSTARQNPSLRGGSRPEVGRRRGNPASRPLPGHLNTSLRGESRPLVRRHTSTSSASTATAPNPAFPALSWNLTTISDDIYCGQVNSGGDLVSTGSLGICRRAEIASIS